MALNGYGFYYPTSGSRIAIPEDIKSFLDSVGPRSLGNYASATERDALITAPAEGMVAWLRDMQSQYIYTASGWERYGARSTTDSFTLQFGSKFFIAFTYAGTTDASGDFDIVGGVALGIGSISNEWNGWYLYNGDGAARPNCNFQAMNVAPIVYTGPGKVRVIVSNTNVAAASVSCRFNGYMIGW